MNNIDSYRTGKKILSIISIIALISFLLPNILSVCNFKLNAAGEDNMKMPPEF